MNFSMMTDEEIREYAAGLIVATKGGSIDWYANSAALAASDGWVGMRRNENYGAVGFTPLVPIVPDAAARLNRAQSCFRWGY